MSGGACTHCHEYPEGSACAASGCPGRPFNKTPAPRLLGSDCASGTHHGHAAEVTSDGGITGFITRRESMAMAHVAAGSFPSPSPHWPFKGWADPRKGRVLVACEYSATVRDAFRARGFDAWSCDLLPTEGDPRWHIQGDVLALLGDGWDLLIAHPPCTDLSVSGARHFAAKIADGRQARALDFVQRLLDAPIKHIALENPVSVISSHIRKPDQIIQPWQFGHGETKATCLWLKNLPRLKPTDIVEGREARIHKMPPGPNRWKERSRTFAGIAAAMADQWGDWIARPSAQPIGGNGLALAQLHGGMPLDVSSHDESITP